MNDSYWAKKVGGMDIRVESINKRLDLEIRESMIQDCQRLWQGRGEIHVRYRQNKAIVVSVQSVSCQVTQ